MQRKTGKLLEVRGRSQVYKQKCEVKTVQYAFRDSAGLVRLESRDPREDAGLVSEKVDSQPTMNYAECEAKELVVHLFGNSILKDFDHKDDTTKVVFQE